MKNVILLQKYYLPWELEKEIGRFIEYYNYYRYHESINNLIPRDVFYGREREIITRRDRIKRRTLEIRRNLILKNIYNNQNNNSINNKSNNVIDNTKSIY